MSCQLIHYTHEEHDKFFELCKNFDFIIVRCNPGPFHVETFSNIQLFGASNSHLLYVVRNHKEIKKPAWNHWFVEPHGHRWLATTLLRHCAFAGQIKADGGDQQKFDDGMRGIRKLGKQVWPSPDVMEKMGAKDALCKADLKIKCLKYCSDGWWGWFGSLKMEDDERSRTLQHESLQLIIVLQHLCFWIVSCIRSRPWTLALRIPWHTTLQKSSAPASRRPWRSNHVSSSRTAAPPVRAFGSSSWRMRSLTRERSYRKLSRGQDVGLIWLLVERSHNSGLASWNTRFFVEWWMACKQNWGDISKFKAMQYGIGIRWNACVCWVHNLSICGTSAAIRNYCKEYGERLCEDSEKLLLFEANDNHEEEQPGLCSAEICKAV